MASRTFTRTALLLLSGPLIWAGHFLLIYVATGVICARRGPGEVAGRQRCCLADPSCHGRGLGAIGFIHLRVKPEGLLPPCA